MPGSLRYRPDRYARGGNLHDFGVEFPDFLSGFEPAAQLVYLPDTARLTCLCSVFVKSKSGSAASAASQASAKVDPA